jgi:hypothetical protein
VLQITEDEAPSYTLTKYAAQHFLKQKKVTLAKKFIDNKDLCVFNPVTSPLVGATKLLFTICA